MLRLILVLVFCAALSVADEPVGKRAVGAKGELKCGNKPAEGVVVRLFRSPQKKEDDLNQILDEKITGMGGMFHVEGNTNGFPLNETTIDPVISFYHSCGEDAAKAKKNGYRKFNYHVPKEYVTMGAKAKKAYDMGTLNVEVEFPAEKHDKKFKERSPSKFLFF